MILVAVILGILGLVGGSFVNALVWRLHQQETEGSRDLSIVNGRSICPHCRHPLAGYDLIPIFSWLFLGGHCRYCGQSISVQYPLVELSGAVVFIGSYLLWPNALTSVPDRILFSGWLVSSVGLLALLVYDARWMLLPNKIIYPTLGAAVLARLIFALHQPTIGSAITHWLLGVAVASGLFWVLFHISDELIGFGDVRLGLITGTLLATPAMSCLMLFMASILGLIFALPSVLNKRRNFKSQLPFGPFLITACFFVMLFGQTFINWYSRVLP